MKCSTVVIYDTAFWFHSKRTIARKGITEDNLIPTTAANNYQPKDQVTSEVRTP